MTSSPYALTVLTAVPYHLHQPRPLLTKQHWPDHSKDFDNVTNYTSAVVEAQTIHELSAVMVELEGMPNNCVIRAEPLPGLLGRIVKRRKNGDQAAFVEVRRCAFMVDSDSLPLPEGLDLLVRPEEAARHLIAQLPSEFHDVSCHWQLSSSAGIKTATTIKMHIWFMADRPLLDAELKLWAKVYNAHWALSRGLPWKGREGQKHKLIDDALFQGVQPHYTATPLFHDGRVDPVSRRSGLLVGSRDVVALELLTVFPEEVKPVKSPKVRPEMKAKEPKVKPEPTFKEPRAAKVVDVVEVEIPDDLIAEDRNELAWTTRRDVFLDLLNESEEHPDQDDFEAESWARFKSMAVTGDKAKYTREGWERECRGEYDRLSSYYPVTADEDAPTAQPFNLLQLAEAETMTREVILEAIHQRYSAAAKIAAGVGKTASAINAVTNDPSNPTVHFYANQHKNCVEVRDKFLARGVSAVVVQGRELAGCTKLDSVSAAITAGLPVKAVCCSSCPDRAGCKYLAQFKQLAQVWVMPHAYLTLELDRGIPEPDYVIVDEEFIGQCACVDEIDVSNLNDGVAGDLLGWLHDQRGDLRDRISRDILASELADREVIESARIREAIVFRNKRSRPDRMIPVLRALLVEWESNQPIKSISLVENKLILRHWKEPVAFSVPFLLLDATMEEAVIKLRWPDTSFWDIAAPRNARVRQQRTNAISKSALTIRAGADELVRKNQVVIDREAKSHSHGLVVTYNECKALFSIPDGWAVEHFGGGVRGSNAYEDFTCVIVIGRNLIPDWAIHHQAAALLHGLNVECDFEERQFQKRGPTFAAPILAALDRMRLDAETTQAADRIRSVRAAETKTIILGSSHQVAGIDVHELMTLAELAKEDELMMLMERLGTKAVPLSLDWLMDTLSISESTARRAKVRLCGGEFVLNERVSKPPIESIGKNDTLIFPIRLQGSRGTLPTACTQPGTHVHEVEDDLARLLARPISLPEASAQVIWKPITDLHDGALVIAGNSKVGDFVSG